MQLTNYSTARRIHFRVKVLTGAIVLGLSSSTFALPGNPGYTKVQCAAACFACGFTLFVGPTCDTWIACLGEDKFAANTAGDDAASAASAWLQALDSCMTLPDQLDGCVDSETAASAAGKAWSLQFDCSDAACSVGTGDLSIKNEGSSTDTALVWMFSDQGPIELSAAQSVVADIGAGATEIVNFAGVLSGVSYYRFVVASVGGPGKNGDGVASLAVDVPATGACCSENPTCDSTSTSCVEDVTADGCQSVGGRFFQGGSCAEACVNGTCVPATSEWGLAALALLVLTAGTIVANRRRLPEIE